MRKILTLLLLFICYFGFAQSPTYDNITLRDQATIRQKAYFIPTISAPAIAREGMLYADTDHNLYYYNGTGWVKMGSNWTFVDSATDTLKNNLALTGIIAIKGNLELQPATTTVGQLKQGGFTLLHTLGSENLFLGAESGNLTLTTAVHNTALGWRALANIDTGDSNTVAGAMAGYGVASGNNNTHMGTFAGNLNLGSRNTSFGSYAGDITTGSDNTSVGYHAMSWGNGGGSNHNVALGASSLAKLAQGDYNTVTGSAAGDVISDGSFNTIYGFNAGGALTTGDSNVLIGTSAGAQLTTESDQLYIDNTNTTTPLIQGNFRTDELTINGQVFVPDIVATGAKYDGYIAGIGIDDRLFPKSIIDLYNDIQDTLADDPTASAYSHWQRDTTNGYIYLSRSTDKVGLGLNNPSQQLEITGNFELPEATATTGIIYKASNPWLHDFYKTGTSGKNIWLGEAGNLTLTGSVSGDEGSANIGIGYLTLKSLTTGKYNTAIGYRACEFNTTGFGNTNIGYNAGQINAAGTDYTTFVGYNAGRNNDVDYNTAVGALALESNTTGHSNTAIGANTLDEGTTPYEMTAIGLNAMGSVTYGYGSVAIGVNALGSSDTIVTNIAIGNDVLKVSRYACNVGVGAGCLSETVYALDNIAMGTGAMARAKADAKYGTTWTGSENVAIGVYAGDSINYSGEAAGTGTGNVLLGHYVMTRGRTINKNVAVGWLAGFNNITGDSNTYMGNTSGYLSTGSHNNFYGDGSGYSETGNYKSYWSQAGTSWINAMNTDSKLLWYADQSDANKSNHFMNIFAKVAIGEVKALSAYALEVVGDVNITGDVNSESISYTDPAPWMDSFRKAPFYSTEFIGSNYFPFYNAAIASGTLGLGTANSNHPGVVNITSSTTTNSGYMIQTYADNVIWIGGGEIYEVIFNPALLAGTTVRLGYHDASTVTAPGDGVYLEIPADSTIVGKTANNGTRSTTGTGYELSLSTWYRAKLVVNADATRIDYYLYNEAGTQLWTDNLTTNIPTARPCGCITIATNVGTTALALVALDYISIMLGTLVR